MKIQELIEKYSADYSKLVDNLCVDAIDRTIDKNTELYDGIHTVLNRPDKIVGTGSNTKVVKQAKLIVKYQKKITETAVSFLFGEPTDLKLTNKEEKYQEPFKLIKDVWKKNKLEYFNRNLARMLMIETKVAELWYVTIDDKKVKHIKVVLLCQENGDKIYVHHNEYRDLDAFIRRYNMDDVDGKPHEHVDIYTADKIIYGVNVDNVWKQDSQENIYGKIPVIYYSKPKPEWDDVQTEIDRIEDLISKFADTNDYFGSPTIKIKGKLTNPPEKGAVGKSLQFTAQKDGDGKISYGDAEYLTWEHAPESIKLEYETLKDIIYSMTSTPDLSFQNVQGLTRTSGEALKFLFIDAILKAKSSQEIFGEGLTRRVNLLKAILGIASVKDKQNLNELDIVLEFGDVLPDSVTDLVNSLSQARGGDPIMSRAAAVRKNPLVEDAEEDLDRLNKEKEKSEVANLGESFNV